VKITAREKRFLIVGSVIGIALLAYFLIPVLIPEDLTVTVKRKQNALRQEKETISQEEGYRARIAQCEERLAKDRARLWPGGSATAIPSMLKVLQEIADGSQVEIISKQILAEQKVQENVSKIAVQLQVNCTLDQLVRFLSGVESYEKFLKVENLMINSRRQGNKDVLFVQMLKVVGYVEAPSPPAKSAGTSGGAN
jgi:Tfp pilus assembly protein PilO